MIKPSEIDTSEHFNDSAYQEWYKEYVARNIVIVSQAVAFARDDDNWHTFTQDDYVAVREMIHHRPVGEHEKDILGDLLRSGDLVTDGTDGYSVSELFLISMLPFRKIDRSEASKAQTGGESRWKHAGTSLIHLLTS